MSRSIKHTRQDTRLILEELEQRRLFSGGAEGLIDTGDEPETDPLFRDLDIQEAPAEDSANAAAAEQQTHEIVFVDAGVESYELLVEDIRGNLDPDRELEVVVLERDRDGIEQISEQLRNYSDLDAIHIISHGSDGSVELGNTSLDKDTLQQNNLRIALWANAFTEIGDILIYGCDLAATETGQSLIEELGALTLTDVAASTDLTGAGSQGGDWLLEYRAGTVESSLAVSAEMQQEYRHTLATYTVTTLADSGAGSLRQAIIDANANGGGDTVEFAVAGTISLTSGLPSINDTLDIDATTAPGYAGEPLVTLDGSAAGATDGLRFGSNADGSSVQGLAIVNFSDSGIRIAPGADGISITGNWIGTTGTGTTGDGNASHGIIVRGANTIISGNVITNNGGDGIEILDPGSTGTVIQGNIIGLDPDGSTGSGNVGVGIDVQSDANNTTIGGTAAGEGNVISANGDDGILISSDNNIVQGNYIGTDITGTLNRGNIDDGVEILNNGSNNLIGGTVPGAGNLIAYTVDDGIDIDNGTGNAYLGNQVFGSGDNDFEISPTANNGQAAPVLASAEVNAEGQIDITGSLTSSPNSYYRIEFFGKNGVVLGYINVATDGAGNANFVANLSVDVASGTAVTATATASDAGYSSFTDTSLPSAGITAVRLAPKAFDDPGEYTSEVQNLDPLGYWRLGDSGGGATDLGSASNTGTYSGASLGQSGGIVGDADTAAYFDGGDYVEIQHNDAYLIDEGTVQAWFNVDNPTAGGLQHIFSKDGTGFMSGGHLSMAINSAGQLEVRLQSDTASYTVTSAASVTAGTWHHAAFSFGADGMRLYLDGVLVASDAYTGGIASTSGGAGNFEDIAIGAGTRNSGSPDVTPVTELFTGSIDEVAIFGDQLDAATIAQLFSAGVNTLEVAENSSLSVAAAGGVLINDYDEQGDPLTVFEVNGNPAAVGSQTTLASGALLTLNSDGSFDYDPNGQFEALGTGDTATDSFDYTVSDGNGGTDTATVTITVNGLADPPVITSAAGFNVAENSTAVTTVTASDPEMDTLTYSISGGADQGFFSIDAASGALSFTTPPDFDAPADSGADNTYQVEVTVDDGNGGFDTQTITVSVTNANDSVAALDDAYNVGEDAVLTSDAGWFDADWLYRRTLSFDNSARSENLVDFPVLITLDSSVIDYAKTHDQGDDLRFFDQDGTALSHEIEVWNESGTSYVWVKIPQIDANSDTDSIVMYYGNAAVAGNGQDPAGVWSDYVATYHLNEDPGAGGTLADAAGSYDATNVGSTDAAGVIGNAQDFNGIDQYVDLGADRPWINNASGATLSLWINADTTTGSHDLIGLSVFEADGSSSASRITLIREGDEIRMIGRSQDDSSDVITVTTTTSPLAAGQWHHVTGTIDYASDIDNLRIYVDGVLQGTFSHDFVGPVQNTNSSDAGMGSNEGGAGGFYDGRIDEARIADSVRSADWIAAQYAAMTGNLVNIGYEQTVEGVLVNDVDRQGAVLAATQVNGAPAAIGNPTALPSGAILTLNADGSFVYDTNGVFGWLKTGESTIDSFTYRVEGTNGDWDTATVTLTIDGADDAPVIGGTDSGAVTEDVGVSGGLISTGDSLTISDDDAGESAFQAATVSGSYGDLTIDAAGNWTYSADNSQGAIQALDAGESLTETLTVTTFDGTLHDIVITINGAEDAAVISGTTAGSVTEDAGVAASGTLTISDPDTSDTPSFPDVPATGGDNGYGDFAMTGGTWTYTLDDSNPAVQALDVGETLTDTFTFTASDGSSQLVTITINGAEDASVISGTTAGSVTEDAGVAASGTLTISDPDTSDTPSFPDVPATGGDNGYGDFAMTGGTWTYTLDDSNPAVQALDVGETLTDTFTFTASDGSSQLVTITINGAEDAAVISGTTAGSVTEDAGVAASGTLTISDPDTSDTPSFPDVPATGGDNGYGDFAMTGGTWTYTLDDSNPAVQALDVGETLTDTFTFTASDGSSQLVTITINGAEDAAVISGTTAGSVTEDAGVAASGTLTISDPDTSDTPSFPDVPATGGDNGYGDFAMTGGTWTYTLDDSNPAVQALDVGETLTDTFTFTASDGSSQLVTITINGAEDASVISGTTAGSVTEDAGVAASGTLTISDPDTSDTPSFPDVPATGGDNGYGDFAMTGGTWTYTLDDSNPAVQALDVGETLTDTFTFTASDGSSQLVTITINGAEDAAVISGTTAGSVTEDAGVAASGTLTISDPDTSDTPSFPDVPATGGDNGYGDFAMTGGTWTYTLDDSNPAVQALDVGETLTDTFTFTASDGSSQLVTITINGAEDASVISGTTAGSVTEDAGVAASGTLTISDPDTSDTPSFPDVPATGGDNGYGDFAMTGGTWTYTLDDSNPAVQALDVGETLTDTFTFTASDGSSQLVTITINGAEDAAVISGTTAGSVTEDAGVAASGTLTISDPDTSDTPSFPDVPATGGDNGYGDFAMTGGTWTYTLDDSNPAVQALDVGETLTDTYTFVASDGSPQTVTVTINGAEDNPSVDNPIADQSATEDIAFNFTFPANAFGDLDASDTLSYAATLSDDSPLPAWLSFDAATRSFSGTPANADVGAIDIKVTADDGSSSVSDIFTLTVVNTNDPPVISGSGSATVTEDIDVSGGMLSASGKMAITDPDPGESSFLAQTVNGIYGSLIIDAAGNWSYTADNGTAAIQSLSGSETLVDTLTVSTADGTTYDILITIVGAPDAPPAVESVTPSPGYVPPAGDEPQPEPAQLQLVVDSISTQQVLPEIESLPRDRELTPPGEIAGAPQSDPAPVQDVQYASPESDRQQPKPETSSSQQAARPSGQPLDVDSLGLQVSDDEALNERFEQALLKHIDRMHLGIDGETGYRSADDIKVQILMGATASLTAGIVSWVLRGGSLLASLMSTVPLLNRFDPLPILKNREDEEDVEPDDDTEITGPVGEQTRRVDDMFSGREDA